MRRRLAKVLRDWADRLAPEPEPGVGFWLALASHNLAPGTLYFDHCSGRVFRIGTAGQAEDATHSSAAAHDPAANRF